VNADGLVSETCEIEIDGRTLTATPGERLLDVAARNGITIRTSCYRPERAIAVCFFCAAGLRSPTGMRLIKCCITTVEPGMVIDTSHRRP
jgi:predicted molibdopterin-dependent oxidoreductase YjgC